MPNNVPLTGMTPSALWRLQQILIAQEQAEAERRQAEARKLELANDPLEQAKQQAAVEMLRNRRDVRPMSLPEEGDFLGAGEPLGGGVEAMRPRSGVPLGPIVGPPAGQGGIERGITAPRFDEQQSLSTIVPRVRGGKPRITEGQSASTRRSTGGPRATPMLPRASAETFTSEFADQVPRMLAAQGKGQPQRGPMVRSRTAFTDRDTPITEIRQQAEQLRDPKFPTVFAGRRAEARLDPQVMAAEIYGPRVPTGGRGAGQAEGRARSALTLLGQLETLSGRLHTGEGPGQAAKGLMGKALAPLNLADDVQAYEALAGALASSLAALVQGSRPSDLDLRIYREFIPPVTRGKENARAAITAMRRIVIDASARGGFESADELMDLLREGMAMAPRMGGGERPDAGEQDFTIISRTPGR